MVFDSDSTKQAREVLFLANHNPLSILIYTLIKPWLKSESPKTFSTQTK